MRLPTVRREKKGLTVRTSAGIVRLSRDGGRLEWLDDSGAVLRAVELEATLTTPDGVSRIRQGADPDPRLVICEQGPVRTVFRSQFDLLDEAAVRWGEGLTEWTLYSDGVIAGVVSLRFISTDLNARLMMAGLCMSGAGPSPQQLILEGDGFIRTDMSAAVPFSAMVSGAELEDLCISWQEGASSPYVHGKGAWHGTEGAPYFEDWGSLPGQDWGDSGWSAGKGAGLYLDGDRDLFRMAFIQDDEGELLPSVYSLQGQLLMVSSAGPDAAARVSHWRESDILEVSGAEYRGYSVSDATHLIYAPDGEEWALQMPPSSAAVAIHVYGLSHWGGWDVTCDGAVLVPQLVNDGRGCDDPNGVQLGRFDDRHGPIRGRTDAPANRMFLLVPPGDEPRSIRVRAVDGLALSYLRWDDRQMYLLQSSANPRRNLVELVVRDGKIRNVVAPHSDEASVAMMPLYWFQCNTPTPYMAIEDVQEYVLQKAGPDVVEFEVHARNRYGCATGLYRVQIPFHAGLTRVNVDAELEALKSWEFSDLQLLNMFAEEFREHSRWPHEYALAFNSSGQCMLKEPKQGRKAVGEESFVDYSPPLLFAHYSASRGNVFLAHTRVGGPVTCQHILCSHWIDSHFHVKSEAGRLEPGDRVTGSYVMIVDDGRERTTEEVARLSKGVIEGQDLGELLS